MESLFGKVAAITGQAVDGTPHRLLSAEDSSVRKIMLDYGVEPTGKEIMYNGMTGEMLEDPVFIGITYYQRLTHLVSNKMHARCAGPRQILTRQPVEGRSRQGGFRMGEMERDALLAHGATSVIMDRFLNCSDRFELPICKTCGNMAEPAAPSDQAQFTMTHKTPYCRLCNSNDNIAICVQPYAMKVLAQELQACHINLKYNVD
jgi:DNA-directed RNA polymerase beta subunit